MKTNIEKSFMAGVGLLSMTREKAQMVVDDLSKRGELEKDQVETWVDQLTHRGEDERKTARKMIRDEIKSAMDELGVVTKADLEHLSAKEKTQDKEKTA